jgi:hypothetical protein
LKKLVRQPLVLSVPEHRVAERIDFSIVFFHEFVPDP